MEFCNNYIEPRLITSELMSCRYTRIIRLSAVRMTLCRISKVRVVRGTCFALLWNSPSHTISPFRVYVNYAWALCNNEPRSLVGTRYLLCIHLYLPKSWLLDANFVVVQNGTLLWHLSVRGWPTCQVAGTLIHPAHTNRLNCGKIGTFLK